MSNKLVITGPHFSNFVRCVALCCLEKGVEYELRELRKPDKRIAKLNPFRKVPIVEYDGMVIYETAAIARFIDRAFEGPALAPTDIREQAWMEQWISAAVCYFDQAIIRRYVLEYAFPKGESGSVRQEVVSESEEMIRNHLGIMSEALDQHDYFSGSAPGIADYLIMPMLDYLDNGIAPTRFLEEYPRVKLYFDKLMQRSSCQQILGNPLT